jgi:DNA-binding GntR family transcriptional regulator
MRALIRLPYFTKKDAVAEWLQNEILSGSLPSGTQLHQDEVAKRLDVSPTPVREAFRELEAEGLLVSRPHRGVVVVERAYDDLKALLEIRSLIETQAARRAATRLTRDAAEELGNLLKTSERALKTADLQTTRASNGRFHEVLVAQAGARVYSELARSLIAQSRYYLPVSLQRMREAVRHHQAILGALKVRDAAGAASLMEKHMQANLRWLQKTNVKPGRDSLKAAERARR